MNGMEVALRRIAMSSLFFDVRAAFRQVVRYPGFSTLVVITLALGIGATTTFFSILDAFIFRPLPYLGS